ncbi:MAG: hypothetical protein QFC78_06490 [Pseudomonadota bacterium]|nr:hypothetical protein [Pseudomonadota bacterium]
MAADAAAFADPYVFCFGFLLTAIGLMLSQAHRDEGITLSMRTGLPFNLLRKASAAEMLVGLILGFWVVGLWWLLWLPMLVLLTAIPVHLLRMARQRVAVTMVLMATGLSLALWAQGPTLVKMGIVPSLQNYGDTLLNTLNSNSVDSSSTQLLARATLHRRGHAIACPRLREALLPAFPTPSQFAMIAAAL